MSALQTIKIDEITPSPYNQRHVTDKDAAVIELAASIKAVGLLQPITVRAISVLADPKKTARTAAKYELVCGERRWRASRVAGGKTIEAIVRPLDDQAARVACVTENMQRQDLTPIEEARGVRTLLDGGWDAARVADRLGKSTSWVARRAALTNLVEPVRAAYEKPEGDGSLARWTAAHLELVARLPAAAQEAWWNSADDDLDYVVTWSVDELRGQLENEVRDLKKVPWDVREAGLGGCRACAGCMARTAAQTELFDDVGKKEDKCLDAGCFDKKMKAWRAARVAEYRAKYPNLVENAKYYEYADAKKGDKGAVPVLSFTGGAAKLEWKKKRPNVCGSAAPRDPEKVKRERLKAERQEHVAAAVAKAMRTLKKRPSTLTALQVLDLATQNPYDELKLGDDKLTVDGMAEREWPIVRDRLSRNLAYSEKSLSLAVRVLGLDVKALEAAAVAAHPDPKPKAAKASTAKKSATKAAGKKKGGSSRD